MLSLLFVLAAAIPAQPAAQESGGTEHADFQFQRGDRICLVGGALAERMQHDGWLETRFQLRFAEQELSFRNLGFNADELDVKQRTAGFLSPDEYLNHCQADVIFAFFGYNESFAGPGGLDEFKKQLTEYIEHTRQTSYNGERPARLVLFTPTSFEGRDEASFPLASEANENIELYARMMRAVGGEKKVPVIDLFGPSKALFAAAAGPLTLNGIHFSAAGSESLARLIEEQLFGPSTRSSSQAQANSLRDTVLNKNLHWFNRYRTTDGYNVYGGRSSLKYVDDLSNYTVLQRELEVLDAMTANFDRDIWEMARGDGVTRPDLPVPSQIKVVTNKPGGGEDGQHLFQRAEVAITSMTVPEGLSIELFADEAEFPELVNPVQMAWDPSGRLWVAVWPTYPHWRPGDPMDDKLLIFEDTNRDGKADICKTFADGLHNITGFEFWQGGVYVACAPELLFLEDTDGDDQYDRLEHVLGGLSSADTHHGANSLVIGQDGALYFQEGTFHMSQIESIYGPVRNRNGCVWRFEPRTFRVERYIPYNFANPHGHVFNGWGQDFMTDGTGNANYYALPFSGHVSEPDKHGEYFTFFQQNTRPSGATELLVSEHFGPEYQGNYLIANVIGRQGILRYEVLEEGSGFGAKELEPLVMSSDPNFRPVDLEVAPDGSLYLLDWQNPIIGHMQHHLRDPSRDGSHGRIYRIRDTQRPLLETVSAADRPLAELLELLKSGMDRLRYRARIELSSRGREDVVLAVRDWVEELDQSAARYEHHRLEALWVQQEFDVLDIPLLVDLLDSDDHRVRAAATRVVRGMRDHLATPLEVLAQCVDDPHPQVRLEAVVALSHFPEARAAELALQALVHPTDRFLDYAIQETVRELKPIWRDALVKGESFCKSNPAGLRFTIEQLSTQDLLEVPGNVNVWREQLVRHELMTEEYIAAAEGLASFLGESTTEILLRAIEVADLRTKGHVDHLISNLFKALAQTVQSGDEELTRRLDEIAEASKRSTTRRLTVVAQLKSGTSVEALWSTAEASIGGLVSLLDAATLVDDEGLAQDLFPRVLARFEASEVESSEGTEGRYVRIELPGQRRTLTLAEVEVFHRNINLARGGTATQSATKWGGLPERGIDGIKSGAWGENGQTHTPEDQPDPWWEVDLAAEMPIDRISIWNRDDNDGAYASRLDDFVLRILDENRRTVFTTRIAKAQLNETSIPVMAPEELLQRVSIPALARLSSGDESRRALALQTMLAHFDDPWVQDEIVSALSAMADETWPAGTREALAQRLIEVLETGDAEAFMSTGGRHLLGLADRLAPSLAADQQKRLMRLRGTLGPRVLVIRPVADSLKFDIEEFSVLAGRSVELIFENTDIMPHNLVITAPGKLAEVGRAGEAMSADPDAWKKGYVPDSSAVLHFSGLLQSGASQTLSFQAPAEAGDYPYVCTFPGHWIRMNGVMHVVEDPLAQDQSERVVAENGVDQTRSFVRNWTVADFLPQLEELETRSAARGVEVLEGSSCLRCHRIEEEGTSTGPSMRAALDKYDRKGLLEQMLHPSKTIAEGYETEIFVLTDGEILAGIVVEESDTQVHLRDDPYRQDFLVLDKSEIAEREVSKVSTMPDGLLTTFERDEILDMLAFFEFLRSRPPTK